MQIITFKDDLCKAQWDSNLIWSPLVCIVMYLAILSWIWWHKTIVITSIYRDVDPAGVHNNWRAVDVRNANFSHEQAMQLADAINEWCMYDPGRPAMNACITWELDPAGKHNDHFHCQVHPNTIFKEAANA